MVRIISILMSVLLLVSSTGITYAQHYCGEFEMLAKVTVGKEHLSCGMVMQVSGCEEGDADDHTCCDNKYTSVSTDDNFTKASFNIDFQQTFLLPFVSVFLLQPLVEYEIGLNHYPLYHPPPLYKNIPVLYETFLI